MLMLMMAVQYFIISIVTVLSAMVAGEGNRVRGEGSAFGVSVTEGLAVFFSPV